MMRPIPTPRQFYRGLPRDYWHVREPTGSNFTPGTLAGYYIDMRAKARPYSGPSRDGFPLRNQNGESWQLLPVTVTQRALGLYESWLLGRDDEQLDQFIACADWLVAHHGPCPGKKDGWSYYFDHRRLGIKAPFISAMGQGQGISVLCRAHHVTGDERYLATAQRALQPFYFEVGQGGVLARTDEGIYFEEYPCHPYSHILNGHIFAAWGLYDYSIYQQDSQVADLFQQGTNTLQQFLARYDVGFWSRYGLFPHPLPNVATPFYHELHIAQLRAMFALTEIQEFSEFAVTWERQFDRWLCFGRALGRKIRFKAWLKLRQATRRNASGPRLAAGDSQSDLQSSPADSEDGRDVPNKSWRSTRHLEVLR